MLLRNIALTALLFLGSTSIASALTPSEKAAKHNLPPTKQESALLKKECSLSFKSVEKRKIDKGVTAKIVKLSEVTILTSVRWVYNGSAKGTYSIQTFTDLPNGGIAAKDFCSAVKIQAKSDPKRKGDVLAIIGLRLRPGLDLTRDYPTAARKIKSKKLIETFSAGKYAVFDTRRKIVSDWITTSGKDWAAAHSTSSNWLVVESKNAIRLSQ